MITTGGSPRQIHAHIQIISNNQVYMKATIAVQDAKSQNLKYPSK